MPEQDETITQDNALRDDSEPNTHALGEDDQAEGDDESREANEALKGHEPRLIAMVHGGILALQEAALKMGDTNSHATLRRIERDLDGLTGPFHMVLATPRNAVHMLSGAQKADSLAQRHNLHQDQLAHRENLGSSRPATGDPIQRHSGVSLGQKFDDDGKPIGNRPAGM